MKPLRMGLAVLVLSVCLVHLKAAVAGGKDSYRLKYKMEKGQTFEYAVSEVREVTQEMMGTEVTSESKTEARLKLQSEGPSKAGNLVFTMFYENFKLNLKSMRIDTVLQDPAALIGKRTRKVITATGDQVKSIQIDTVKVNPIFAQALNNSGEFLPNLPNSELRIGEPVNSSDVDTTYLFGGSTVSRSDVEYTLVGPEPKSGYNCLKIAFKGTISLEGDGKFQGFDFALEGDGDIEGTLFFEPGKGLLVAAENQADLEMTAAITGQQNLTIPITQSLNSTITLVK
ncbi:MAG: hypothetical protein ACE5HO_05235 [bacterium]